MSPEPLLAVDDLHVYFGVSHILQGITLAVDAEPLSIIGRNGMGKTTLCEAIMGLVPARQGRIRVAGLDTTGRRPFRVAQAGLGYVPQGRRIFPSLSVDEHLRLIAKTGGKWTIDRVYDTFPRLAERRGNGGAELSGGEQQMLAIARALLLNPKLLVMDEPTEGLAPVIVDQLIHVFRQLAHEGIGIFLVEQNFAVATSVSKRVLVMMNGAIALETSSAEIAADEDMQRRYLGVSTRTH